MNIKLDNSNTTITVEETRDGVKFIIDHQDTDSLAIVEVRHGYDTLATRVGMRGNFDVVERPIQRTTHSLRAPLVSAAERAQRKARWMRKNAWRFR